MEWNFIDDKLHVLDDKLDGSAKINNIFIYSTQKKFFYRMIRFHWLSVISLILLR